MALEAGDKCILIPDGKGGYTAHEISTPEVGDKCILIPDGKGGYIASACGNLEAGDKTILFPDKRLVWAAAKGWILLVDGADEIPYAQMIAFNDHLYLELCYHSGQDNEGNYIYQVSAQGDLTLITDSPEYMDGYGYVQYHRFIVQGDTVYKVLGLPKGWVNWTPYSKVYSSTDMETWNLVTDDAGITRFWFGACSDGTYGYILGGLDEFGVQKHDVWRSSDMATWEEVTVNTPFNGRWYHDSIYYDNKLWVIGGHDDAIGGFNTNDIWYSSDSGVNWVKSGDIPGVTGDVGAVEGFEPKVTIYDEKMWILKSNGVIYTSDGANFTDTVYPGFGGFYCCIGTLNYPMVYARGGIYKYKG